MKNRVRSFILVISSILIFSNIQAQELNADKLRGQLVIQAYSFKKFSFTEAIDKTHQLGLKNIEIYFGQQLGFDVDGKMDFHMDNATRQRVFDYAKSRGVKITSCGVVTCKEEAEWKQLFEFASSMGIELIISEPASEDLKLIERLANTYNIDVAIHNHPKPSPYWEPDLFLNAVAGLSSHIGACADMGNWKRMGIDPVEGLEKYIGRLKSLHFKDLEEMIEGESEQHDVIWGTGICSVESLINELKRQDFKGLLTIEYECNWENSMPDIEKSLQYLERIVNGQPDPIKAFCIDFNWGEGGPNGFAAPGLWSDANPQEHIEWYAQLGCNVIQSFAVSCNGYAWYKNGIIPEQPGLKYDFLTEQIRLAHEKDMKVFGYFCAGSNTKWGLEHPELSYGVPSNPHIPYTKQYISYLCMSIEDAIKKTGMDGVFIDWLWNPGETREPFPPLQWINCEQEMYTELMNQPFPGIKNIIPEIELQFRRKAIDRCWKSIRETVKKTKPDCLVWLTSSQLTSKDIAGSDMLKEVDWVLNEAGDIATTESVRSMLGSQTRLITCLANWNGQDPKIVIPAAINDQVGLYGFTRPIIGSMLPPVEYYLSTPIDSLKGDALNIGLLARIYHNLPFDYVRNKN